MASSSKSADPSSNAEGQSEGVSSPPSELFPVSSMQLPEQPPTQQHLQEQQQDQLSLQPVVLEGPGQLHMWDIDNVKWAWHAATWLDSATKAAVASRAAALESGVQSVRLESFGWESELVLACLAVLPAGVTHLDLATRLTGPVPTVLERFNELQSLAISGEHALLCHAAQVDWCCRGSAAAASKLTEICLSFTEADIGCCPCTSVVARTVPAHLTQLLSSHATQLRHLNVEAKWSGDLAELCCSLPSLTRLRLSLLEANQETMAAAVGLLRELTQVQQLTLAVDDGAGSDDEDFPPDEWDLPDDEEQADNGIGRSKALQVPPLAGIPNLAGLEVRRHMVPPPDWRHISSLASLDLRCRAEGIPDWSLPATGLASLTHLRIDCDTLDPERGGAFPPALCHLPKLRHLVLKSPNWRSDQQRLTLKLPPEFTKLTALTRLDTWKLSPQAEQLLREQMPQVSVNVDACPW